MTNQTSKFDRDSVGNEQIRKLHSEAAQHGDESLATDCLAALEGDSDAADRCIDAIESAWVAAQS